ncbi:unnamed protein product, partial [Dovyalis caffra]
HNRRANKAYKRTPICTIFPSGIVSLSLPLSIAYLGLSRRKAQTPSPLALAAIAYSADLGRLCRCGFELEKTKKKEVAFIGTFAKWERGDYGAELGKASAHDSHVLNDALSRSEGLKIPE